MLGFEEQRIVKVVQNAPQVIGVRMGENHMSYILRRNTQCIQTIDDRTRTGHETGTGASIKENSSLAILQKCEVARWFHLITRHSMGFQDWREFILWQRVKEHTAGQYKVAIADAGDRCTPQSQFGRGPQRSPTQEGDGSRTA